MMALKIIVTAVAAFVGFEGADDKLTDPLQLVQANNGKLMLIPVIYAPDGQDLVINPSNIIYTAEPDKVLLDVYEQSQKHLSAIRSGIILAKKDEKIINFLKN